MKNLLKIVLIACIFCLSGCANFDLPPRENTITNLPELSTDLSRIYFLSGTCQMKGGLLYHPDPVKMMEGGDVYINSKFVGYFYRDEVIVIDLAPGAYVVNWVTKLGDFDVKHTKSVPYALVVKNGETKYLIAHKGPGDSSSSMFGLIGALSDPALINSYFMEDKSGNSSIMNHRRIVSYTIFKQN